MEGNGLRPGRMNHPSRSIEEPADSVPVILSKPGPGDGAGTLPEGPAGARDVPARLA